MDVNTFIVGNGLFGRIAHDYLKLHGISSVIIDSLEANSGTMASGNITKPSWVTGLPEAKQAYDDLHEMYGLEKFSPAIAMGKTIDLYYVPRKHTIKQPDVIGKVLKVGDGVIELDNGQKFHGNILVAAGVWSQWLVSMPDTEAIMGVSMTYWKTNHTPQFNIWAPYKQSISYGYGHEVWFGDGTAIKEKNFNRGVRVLASENRAAEHGLTNPTSVNVGIRPYVKGHKNGYFARVHPRTWVSSGGGKNGIVLAMIQARRFLEEISG